MNSVILMKLNAASAMLKVVTNAGVLSNEISAPNTTVIAIVFLRLSLKTVNSVDCCFSGNLIFLIIYFW